MTTPNNPDPQQWQQQSGGSMPPSPGQPGGPVPPSWAGQPAPAGNGDGGRRRRRLVVGGIVAGVLVLALLGIWIAKMAGAFDSSPAPLDRRDPAATATAFLQRYAVHEPTVCELITADLRKRFDRDGRCSGAASGTTPRIDVINAKTCGNRSSFSAEVNPAGEIGKRYVTVGLEQAGDQWAVRSVLPVDDRSVIKPYECAPASTRYGG